MSESRTHNDGEVVREVLGGAADRFGLLVERHIRAAYALAFGYLRNREDAEDAVQDAFIRAYRKLRSLREPERFGAWLLRIVRTTALMQARRRKTGGDAARVDEPSDTPQPERVEIAALLRRRLSEMPRDRREVLLLHYFGGQSTREVAEQLEISREAVKKRLQRGREELGETLLHSLSREDWIETPDAECTRTISAGVLAGVAGLPSFERTRLLSRVVSAMERAPGGVAGVVAVAVLLLVAGSWPLLSRLSSDRDTSTVANAVSPGIAENVAASTEIGSIEPESESSAAAEERVVTGEPTEIVVAEAAQNTGIHGVVLDDAGSGIEDARIVLFHDANDWGLHDRVVEETVSDAEGVFAFSAQAAYLREVNHVDGQDRYVAFASHPEYAAGWAVVKRGAEADALSIALLDGHGGTIQVVADEGTPLPGARVWAYAGGDDDDSDVRYRDRFFVSSDPGVLGAVTGSDGVAFLANLPSTRVNFRVSKPGYALGHAFREGETVTLNRAGRVIGRMVDAEGLPIAGAPVQLRAWWMSLYFKTETDAKGEFVFDALPPHGWSMDTWSKGKTGNGTYQLTVPSERVWVPGTFFSLTPGETRHIELKAEAGTRFHVRVVTEVTRQIVSGAHVQLFAGSFADDPSGYTDEHGEVVFTIPPGSIGCFVDSPPNGVFWDRNVWAEFLPDASKIPVYQVRGEETIVTVTCPEPAGKLVPLTGTVYPPPGVAATDLRVCVSSREDLMLPGRHQDAFFGSTIPDAQGRFTFEGAPEGVPIHAYVDTPDQRYAGVSSMVIPRGMGGGTLPPVQMMLTETAPYIVEGDTLEQTALREIEARLIVNGDELRCGSAHRELKADKDGVFRVPNILPGYEYRMLSWDEADADRFDRINEVVVLLP